MKRVLALCMVICILVCGFAACGQVGSKREDADFMDYTDDMVAEESLEEAGNASGDTSGTNILVSGVDTERKLVYTVWLEISSQQYDADYNTIMQELNACGGYVSSEYTYGTKPEVSGDDGRSTDLQLRIPIEKLEQFLSKIEAGSNVVSKQMEVEDTTDYYFDTESRIELLETRYDKLQGYLEQAETMEDIITLEAEMSDILYQLDELKGTKRGLDDRVAYSTVEISIYEVVNAADVPYESENLGTRIKNALVSSFRGVVSFLEGFIVVLIAALPVLAVVGGLTVIVLLIVKLCIRQSKKHKAKKAAQQQTPVIKQ